ncbi:SMI1/KNR4 family protein [Anatilimnocola floriformis]|uniref:SMI1/KNR4 family protein n=1 Tax=Anatilimnocola floriformis TaxID=2948575 RepID=UPI0020C22968|nr:SMI1/KNR4 family protein [Anatilimnocola floriformis]
MARICLDYPWDDPGPRFSAGKKILGDSRWRQRWLPIAVDAGGNLLAVDLDPGPQGSRGQVIAWNGSPPPRVVAPSYAAWLNAIAEELSARRFDIDDWHALCDSRANVAQRPLQEPANVYVFHFSQYG